MTVLAAATPSNSLGWMYFLAEKYAASSWQGTWLTLYVAVLGTIFGFALGYIIGIIEDIRIDRETGKIRRFPAVLANGICSV